MHMLEIVKGNKVFGMAHTQRRIVNGWVVQKELRNAFDVFLSQSFEKIQELQYTAVVKRNVHNNLKFNLIYQALETERFDK